jgi:RNA polymerase sigma-70 factor (ECF subfamily)
MVENEQAAVLIPPFEDPADLGQRLADPHASQERVLLGREEVATVWSAVEKLSPQQRAIFTLRFVEEMSLEEIAEVTSLKVGTVKTHLFREGCGQGFVTGGSRRPCT